MEVVFAFAVTDVDQRLCGIDRRRMSPDAVRTGRTFMSTSIQPSLTTDPIFRPYLAQGAAQAVEDAAALGILLSTITSRAQIPLALRAYEKSRKWRAETVQQSGTENRIALHLPDGPEQQARDEQFRMSLKSGPNPDKWSDRETQKFLWGWDAERVALDTWNGMIVRVPSEI